MVCAWIQHHVHPERVDAYLEATLANARATQHEPGNLRFDVLRNPDDPAHFVLFEVYVDADAQKAHFASDHFKAWRAAMDGVIARAEISKWKPLHLA